MNDDAANEKALQGKISSLIRQLGGADFSKREEAQKALADIGEPALEQIEQAKTDSDAETAQRATELWSKMHPAAAVLLLTDKKGKPIGRQDVKVKINVGHNIIFGNDENKPGEPPHVIDVTTGEGGTVTLGPRDPGLHTISIETADGRKRVLDLNLHSSARTYRVVLYEGATIKGRIFGEDGKPLDGHQVLLLEDWREARLDEKGNFSFEHVPQGAMQMRISTFNEGSGGEAVFVTVVDGQTAELALHHMEKPAGKLKCKMVGPDGKSYSEYVRMTARLSHPAPGDDPWSFMRCLSEKADAGGVVEFAFDPGTYEVALFADGCLPVVFREVQIKDRATTELPGEIRLVQGITLKVELKGLEEGFVIAAPAGKPLPPVEDIGWNHDFSTDLFYCARALMRGDKVEAVIDGVAPGTYVVRAAVIAHGYSDEATVEIKPGDKEVSLVIDFSKRALLALNIVDKDSGKKIRDILNEELGEGNEGVGTIYDGPDKGCISFTDVSGGYFGPEFNESGRVLIQGCRSGQNVTICAWGYKTLHYKIPEIPAGKTTEATVQMEAFGPGVLKVRLLPGKGLTPDDISGVVISDMQEIEPPTSVSWNFPHGKNIKAKNGVFTAENVSEGACYVSVIGKDGCLRAFYRAEVKKGETTEATFTLPDVGRVEGVLRDHEGNAIPSERIMLAPDCPKTLTTFNKYRKVIGTGLDTYTDNEGRFVFRQVPVGRHILLINHSVGEPEMRFVEVKAGETARMNVDLDKPMSVTITLTLPDGESMPDNATLHLNHVTNNAAGFVHDFDRDYYFWKKSSIVVAGIFPGKYRLWITYRGEDSVSVKEIEIAPGTTTLQIPWSFKEVGAQKISGTIKNLHGPDRPSLIGEYVVAVSDTYMAEVEIKEDGTFDITGLPPGKYHVWVMSIEQACLNRGDYVPVKEVTVEEGKKIESLTIP